jgi:16S rRNA pseudouridine516 synthase
VQKNNRSGDKVAKELRIDKVLSNLGYGSRKEIKTFLKQGRIKINDKIIKNEAVHLDVENDIIKFDEEIIVYKEFEYIMLNKPQGVVSATFDPKETTVLKLLEQRFQNIELFPVGRLDKDTEGLLIMTNDGKLAHDLLSPKKHIYKVYYAEVSGEVNNEDIEKFNEGVVLDGGYTTLPAKLKVIESSQISKVEIEIREGKFHQIKRMFEAVQKKVVYLKRIKMGKIELDENLQLGQYRELTLDEIRELKRFPEN